MFDYDGESQTEAGDPYAGVLPRSEEFAVAACGVAEVTDFADAVDVLTKVDWTLFGADQLGDLLRAHTVLSARLAAVDMAMLDAFDRAADGQRVHGRAVAGWLAAQTGIPRHEASRRVIAARRLRDMPETFSALQMGDIHFAHAVALGKTSEKKHLAWAFTAAERDDLVPAAKSMSWQNFRTVLWKFEQAADPSQGDNDAEHDEARAEFNFSATFEGAFRADGWFDPISGEIVDAELKRLCQQLLADDWAEARARLGDDARIKDLCRSQGQRMKDALVLMARRSAAARTGSLPCVNVHVDYATFTAAMNELAGLPGAYSAEGVRETNAGVPISARQIVGLALEGHVRRVVFDNDGQVLDFGAKKRFFTGALREAVEVRDRVCQHPGCGLPAVWCEVDHVDPFSKGGPTSIKNAQLLCGFHNRRKRDSHMTPWWDQTIDRLVWLTHPPI